MRRYIQALCILATLVSATACDENLSTIAGPTPDLEPTFASIQQFVFEAPDSAGRRACTSCHTNVGRTPAGGMNLLHDVAYANIVNVSSTQRPGVLRVVPGDPDASYIVHKVEGTPGIVGLRMPFIAPYLSDGQILILRRWIALGAPRD